jgi:hypothetical protein
MTTTPVFRPWRSLIPWALAGCAAGGGASPAQPAVPAASAVSRSVAVPADAVFQDQGGLVVIEMEALPLAADGAWVKENDRALGPVSGEGYLRAEVDARTQDKGVLAFRVHIASAGEWNLRLRGRHDHPRSDLENDIFLRIDDGPWLKFWIGKPVGAWVWSGSAHTLDKDHTEKTPIAGALAAGAHTITVAARSRNFKLDKLALFLAPNEARATALDAPQSPFRTAARVATVP